MTFKHLNIAIVAGGLGGLSLLNALLNSAFPPEHLHLYEAAPEFTQVGAGVKITCNANRLLDSWGLKEHMLRASNVHPKNYMEYRHYKTADYVGTVEEFGEPLSRMLHRADLLESLRLKLPRSCISTGRKLEKVDYGVEGYQLHFKDGSTAKADIVVGCDGIKSVVRKHLGLFDLPVYSGQMVYRGFVDYSAFSPDTAEVMRKMVNYRGPRRHVLTMPMGNEAHRNARLGIIAFMTEPMEGFDSESWLAKAPIDDLHEHVKGWNRHVQEIIAGLRKGSDDGLMLKQALYVRQPLDKWFATDSRGGGTVLLGDSAHSTLPHQGQGTVQAIESSFVLAAVLARWSNRDLESALRFYQDFRKPRTDRITQTSYEAGKFGSADIPEDQWEKFDAKKLKERLKWIMEYDVEAELVKEAASKLLPEGTS